MSPSANVPRPDHIAELTRGLTLPLPAIKEVHLHVIAEAISHAFNDLQRQTPTPHSILTGNETDVTALLVARLNRLIGEDRMFRRIARSVARGVESMNFNGARSEFRPDLSIYLTAGMPNFPLIIEAKLIDTTRFKTAALYAQRGIARFVNGGYAWGNREAFMLAYVRDASTIDATLTPYLTNLRAKRPQKYMLNVPPTPIGTGSIDLATSQHGRSFSYIGLSPPDDQPGVITVWHLWLPILST